MTDETVTRLVEYRGLDTGMDRLVTRIVTERPTQDGVPDVWAEPLDARLDLARHSPTGFAWGYEGSGPAQLALALCADALGKEREAVALRVYHGVKRRLVAPMTGEAWCLTRADVLGAVLEQVREDPDHDEALVQWLRDEIWREREAR